MMENPGARGLLLRLLLVADHGRLSAAEAVKGCALFGISENNARVALTRLVAAGLVEAVERGVYRLGARGQVLGAQVLAWRDAEARVVPWTGSWAAVHAGGLGRSDRGELRGRHRALAMLGLRELEPGLFVRPDNLAGGVAVLRERLQALGLPGRAAVFRIEGLDADRESRARRLWNAAALERGYASGLQKLERSQARLPRLPLDAAAREAYLMGDEGIRQLVFDPMLPEPLVDVAARRAFAQAVRGYDEAGHGVWRRFMAGRTAG